jgi:hypothetical protein
MKIGIKHILVGIIVVFLFLPLLQENLNLTKMRPLSGDYVPAKDIPITRHTWLTKEFQDNKEKFLNDHFGYHHTYIRLHNQLAFHLFNKAKANGVIIGKKNYLYEEKYIDAYYGTDFIGVDSIRKRMLMVDYIVDTLKKMNKTFLVVFAPGKASYYPEYIPKNKIAPKGITNMEVYSQLAIEYQIPHINFHAWFIQNKTKSPYPLIPRYGIHWSQYGSVIAADSILKTIEKERSIDIPEMDWKKINIMDAKDADIDIENGMNLLFPFKPEKMAYPEVIYKEALPGQTKPSVLVVGDSYYWQIFGSGISTIFDRSDFWYYFKSAHSPRYEQTKKMEDVDIIDEINQHQVIIIMASDLHLGNLGWGFIETLFGFYQGTIPREKLDPAYYDKIEESMNYIQSDKNWMKEIVKKAKDRNISVDSMLYIDAKWTVDFNEEKNKK